MVADLCQEKEERDLFLAMQAKRDHEQREKFNQQNYLWARKVSEDSATQVQKLF